MENKPPKVDEMKAKELFQHFKEGIIGMVESHFNGHIKAGEDLEPAVFIGIRKKALLNHPKFDEMFPKQMRDEVYSTLDEEYAIHTVLVPLGRFFNDHGHKELNHAMKIGAKTMVDSIIDEFKQFDLNAVMFMVFVSQCTMVEMDAPKDFLNKMATGQFKDSDLIPEGGVKSMENAKERIVMVFETQNSSQMVTFDVLRSDTYQEAINMKEMPESSNPGGGLFSGFLHKGMITDVN